MEAFHFWVQWGSVLNDRDFANAFTALGILAGRPQIQKPAGSIYLNSKDQLMIKSLMLSELTEALSYKPGEDELPSMTGWRFPFPDHQVISGQFHFDLRDLDPQAMAGAWLSLVSGLPSDPPHPKFRMKVVNYPKKTAFRPWYRLLLEADPGEKSVYLDLLTAHPEIHPKWPLRLGHIPGNSAGNPLRKAHSRWPANVNAILHEIGRENDNCDVLAFDGNTGELMQTLRELPVPMKCNLIIIRGKEEDQLPGFCARIMEISNMSRANGFVFLKETFHDGAFEDFLHRMVDGLCHDLPLDFVLTNNFIYFSGYEGDPVLILSDQLANFRLNHMVDQIIRKLDAMPPVARIEVPKATRHRLNLPEFTKPMLPARLKSMLKKNKKEMTYIAESTGATGLSELDQIMETAAMAPEVEESRRDRYISARTFIRRTDDFQPEKRAFMVNKTARIIMRIGPPDPEWVNLEAPIDMTKLPQQQESWRLKVVLSDPNHIREPLTGQIRLPKDGPSTECTFDFIPKEAIAFEGRLTVLHRGRVIQTAVLKMPVVKNLKAMPKTDQLDMAELIPVHSNLGDLDSRLQFDLALVTNHTSTHRPVLTGIAEDHAWLVNLEECQFITEAINEALSDVAFSVDDYKEGLETDKGRELLMQLVLNGCELYNAIVGEVLMRPGNRAEFARKEYLQVVSTRNDSVIPFEFIYDREVPDNDAKLCENWKIALSEGKCLESCTVNGRKTICPLGFWGLSKVIERHDVTPELADGIRNHLLQSEATTHRAQLDFSGPGLFAASAKVAKKDAKKVASSFAGAFGMPALFADNWVKWESEVASHKPHFIVALPHTDGKGANATLEIGNDTIRSIQIRPSHVRPDEDCGYPVVALLGCDTSGSAIEYGKYVRQFRLKGASVVIGTIATVFGGHAARVADMLIQGLTARKGSPERLGEVMRDVKRQALREGLLMALCLVAFGDADWKLK